MSADVAETVWYTEDFAAPLTVSKPGSFGTGQLLVLAIAHDAAAGLADLTGPAGWTEEGSFNVAGCQGKVWSHTYDGSEPSTWDFGYGSGAAMAAGLFRVTGADQTPIIAVTSATSSTSSPSVTPNSTDDCLICAIACIGDGNAFSCGDPSGMTDLGQIQYANLYMAMAAAKQLLSSSGATGAKTWTSVVPPDRQLGTFSIAVATVATSFPITPAVVAGTAGIPAVNVTAGYKPYDPEVLQALTGTATAATFDVDFTAAHAGSQLLLLVGSTVTKSGDPADWTVPTGGAQAGTMLFYGWHRLAAGGEATVTVTMSGTGNHVWTLLEITRSAVVDTSQGTFTNSSGGTYATPTVTPTGGRRYAVAAVGGTRTASQNNAVTVWSSFYSPLTERVLQDTTSVMVSTATLSFDADGALSTDTTATFLNAPDNRTSMILVFRASDDIEAWTFGQNVQVG